MSAQNSPKKQKNVTPVTLEEVFNQVSTATSSNPNPPLSRVVLTPRSAEVCLKLGVNPEVIKIRDIDSFWEPGLDPTVQRMRHEAYVQRRYELTKQCRLEKKKMMNSHAESTQYLNSSDAMSPEKLLQEQVKQSSSMLELEMKRMEKMQSRQEKELQQMVQYEVNRAKIQQEMDARLEAGAKKEELRKKQQQKRMKLLAEERRLKDLQKQITLENEEAARRQLAKDMHQREVAVVNQLKREEEEAAALRQQKEVERKLKHEAHKRQIERFFEEEQQQTRKKLDALHLAEKKKMEAMEQKQVALAAQLKKKREIVEKRIDNNIKMSLFAEQKRKQDFQDRQDAFDRTAQERSRRMEEEHQLHLQDVQLQEQRRKMILFQQQREEEKKKEFMLHKFEDDERHVEEVQKAREKELQLLKEKKSIGTQMKLDNVDRVFRANEYKRMETLRKIEENDKRTKVLEEQKRTLVEDRRRTAAKTKIQKENITKVMDEVRVNASKAQKLITHAMTGKITLDSLLESTNSRSKTAKMKKSKTTSDLLNTNTRSKSANDRKDMQDSNVPPKRFGHEDSAPKPYISPYDAEADSNY